MLVQDGGGAAGVPVPDGADSSPARLQRSDAKRRLGSGASPSVAVEYAESVAQLHQVRARASTAQRRARAHANQRAMPPANALAQDVLSALRRGRDTQPCSDAAAWEVRCSAGQAAVHPPATRTPLLAPA